MGYKIKGSWKKIRLPILWDMVKDINFSTTQSQTLMCSFDDYKKMTGIDLKKVFGYIGSRSVAKIEILFYLPDWNVSVYGGTSFGDFLTNGSYAISTGAIEIVLAVEGTYKVTIYVQNGQDRLVFNNSGISTIGAGQI